jgi:PIN domain nuclease of toxin-antitoxin system
MTTLVLDTHVWVWASLNPSRLTEMIRVAISDTDRIFVSAISFYEISQKVRLGKWPGMETFLESAEAEIQRQGSEVLPVSPLMARVAGGLDWPHRDPFDRLIAATAIVTGSHLVSADTAFDTLPLRRLW